MSEKKTYELEEYNKFLEEVSSCMPGVSLPNLIAGNYSLILFSYKLTSASIDPTDAIFAACNYR